MSEKANKPEQRASQPEKLVSDEQRERIDNLRAENLERSKNNEALKNKTELSNEAKIESTSSETAKKNLADGEKAPKENVFGSQQALKSEAYKRSLEKIQKKLPKTSKAFSKVIHNDAVEAVSNIGAQTIARPSGLLGGSICAFLGSSILLYTSKHYGFRYNYLVLLLLFIGGFALGALIELVVWMLHTRKQRY
ncbi:MAG: hypothetical protein ABI354_02340 [Candidatus Saccharimonadales bacterium]